jgi:hypothetical protein
MSTRLNVARSGDAWMSKVNPQPVPQVKPAVPRPWHVAGADQSTLEANCTFASEYVDGVT